MTDEFIDTARARIAECLERNTEGQLVQRRDHLNLAELWLSDAALAERFEWPERDLGEIGFSDLVHLRHLDLTGNELTRLPESVTQNTGLIWLGLNFNRLEELPEAIGRLKALRRLYLRGNGLSKLPSGFGGLKSLVELDLNGNELVGVSSDFDDLFNGRPENSLHIDFEGNPGELFRLFRTDVDAFRSELKRQRRTTIEVREGKLLFVGEGEVGKSTLLRALLNQSFAGKGELEQTQGVELAPLPLPLGSVEPEVTFNAWDFSGQDPVRDTHQIFFTQPAIYLLVFNARVGTGVQTLIDWLWLIKHRTGSALMNAQSERSRASRVKVLIVGTEVGAGRPQVDDMDRVWRLFGGDGGLLLEEQIHYVECNDKHQGGQKGVAELRDKLLTAAKANAAFRQPVSPAKLAARTQVETARKTRHFVSWDEFETLCHQGGRGLPRDEVKAFAQQQHELGRLVWIDRGVLSPKVILTPDWLGKALAYIFQPRDEDNESVLAGVATQAQVDAEWSQPQRLSTDGGAEPALDREMFPVFRAFMAEFDLWHPIDPESAGDARRYLIPKLFKSSRGAWDDAWLRVPSSGKRFKRQVQINGWDGNPLNTWLLRAFFSRLIVRSYPQLLGQGEEVDRSHWRRGFRLRESYLGDARVWFDKDRGRVFFDAVGSKPESLWYTLRATIERLRQEMACPGTEMDIKLTKYVPCSAAVECTREDSLQAAFFEEKVELWQSKRIETVPCLVDSCEECEISVSRLADGIAGPEPERLSNLQRVHAKLDQMLRNDERRQQFENQTQVFWKNLETEVQTFANTLHSVQAGVEANASQLEQVRHVVGEVKSELVEIIHRLDDDHRVGPCLYFIEPESPEFWKDAGDMFGKKFTLHLCCEHTLIPVSWFKDTAKLGRYSFTMDATWWSATRPYLKVVSRLLGTFLPAAGILGGIQDMEGLLAVSQSDVLNRGSKLYQNLEKLLPLGDGPNFPPESGKAERKTIGRSDLTDAQDLGLKELHAFLREKVKPADLETANLGLQRRWSKTRGRHLWVHPSQAVSFETER